MNSCQLLPFSQYKSGYSGSNLRKPPQSTGLPLELRASVRRLGPFPRQCLETFSDLGLSDKEIAHYFDITQDCVTSLRTLWQIGSR